MSLPRSPHPRLDLAELPLERIAVAVHEHAAYEADLLVVQGWPPSAARAEIDQFLRALTRLVVDRAVDEALAGWSP